MECDTSLGTQIICHTRLRDGLRSTLIVVRVLLLSVPCRCYIIIFDTFIQEELRRKFIVYRVLLLSVPCRRSFIKRLLVSRASLCTWQKEIIWHWLRAHSHFSRCLLHQKSYRQLSYVNWNYDTGHFAHEAACVWPVPVVRLLLP